MVFSNKLQTTDLIENLWATDGIITAAKLCTKAPNNMTFFLMIASLHPVIRLQVMKFIKTGNLRCGRSFLMHCCLTENITIDYNESLIPFIKLFMPQSQRRKSLCMYLLIKLFMKHHVQKEWLPSSVAWVYRLAIMKWSELIQDWVPVGEIIESGTIFQGAMDNFDHDENTMSGKNGSHETIIMLFQNNDVDKPPQDIIHNVPENFKTTEDERTLHYILPCQLLNKGRNVGKRGEIEDSKFYNTICTVISSSQQFLQFETECNYKICFYSYHTSSSNQVWCNIYMCEQFPRCFSTKRFGVWSPMMRWRRLSNS